MITVLTAAGEKTGLCMCFPTLPLVCVKLYDTEVIMSINHRGHVDVFMCVCVLLRDV